MGNRGRTEAGDVQVMSAGSGVTHAEFNLEDEATTLYQIWIMPKERGGKPFWGAAKFPKADRAGALVTLASGFVEDQKAGALPIRQDARILAATLRPGESVAHPLARGRNVYLAVAKGGEGERCRTWPPRRRGDHATKPEIRIEASADTEIVLVDAP